MCATQKLDRPSTLVNTQMDRTSDLGLLFWQHVYIGGRNKDRGHNKDDKEQHDSSVVVFLAMGSYSGHFYCSPETSRMDCAT